MKKLTKGLFLGLLLAVIMPNVVFAHTIHFETYGGTSVDDIEVEDGGYLDLEGITTQKEGWTFDQWTTNSSFEYGNGEWALSNHGNYYDDIHDDMTFYAYFYQTVIVYEYDGTYEHKDEYYAGKVYRPNTDCIRGYTDNMFIFDNAGCEGPWEFVAEANPGYKFVGWSVGYENIAKSSDIDSYYEGWYEGKEFEKTEIVSTDPSILFEPDSGWATVYAVFEVDPDSGVELIENATGTMTQPVIGGKAATEIASSEPEKYSLVLDYYCPWSDETKGGCVGEDDVFEDDHVYALNFYIVPQEGYRLNQMTLVTVNDLKTLRDVTFSPGRSMIFSFMPDYTYVFDYNGGTSNGKGTETVTVNGYYINPSNSIEGELIDVPFFMEGVFSGMVEVIAPIGKQLSGIEVDGEFFDLNSAINVAYVKSTEDKTMSFKYIWENTNGTEPENPEPEYTLVFNYNGGTSNGATTNTYTVNGGAVIEVSEEAFLVGFLNAMSPVTAPEGYVFDGIEVAGQKYTIGDYITIDKDITFKYLWKSTAPKYTIVYDYNGGKKNGNTTTTEVVTSIDLPADKANFANGVTAPLDKELDYVTLNGTKLEWGKWYQFKADGNNTIKYFWKFVPSHLNSFKVGKGNTTSITLVWNRAAQSTSYKVYQSTDNKKWTVIATINNGNTLTYTKTKLTANKKYYYKVEAYKGTTKLVTSKVVTTKTAPKAATLKIKSNTYNSVTFTVGKATGAKKFIIESSTDNKTFTAAKTVTKAGKVTVGGLNTGTKYYFRLKVCNEYNNCSAYSKVVNRKLELKKPTIKVSSKAKTKMTVKVPAVAGATGYEIERSTKKSSGFAKVADVAKATSYTDTGLTSKTKYYYRVRAYRMVNGKKVYSAYSKVANAKVK